MVLFFLDIDGNHDYKFIKNDIDSAFPHIKKLVGLYLMIMNGFKRMGQEKLLMNFVIKIKLKKIYLWWSFICPYYNFEAIEAYHY